MVHAELLIQFESINKSPGGYCLWCMVLSLSYFYTMFSSELIPYSDTKAFTRIVQDYLAGSESLRPFYAELPTVDGIRETIERKKHQQVDRNKLYDILVEQYLLVNKN